MRKINQTQGKLHGLTFPHKTPHIRVDVGNTQPLVSADDVNIMGRSVSAIWKNTEALVVASKEIWLEVNADNTKYTVISRD
jgi:hypothetical protein